MSRGWTWVFSLTLTMLGCPSGVVVCKVLIIEIWAFRQTSERKHELYLELNVHEVTFSTFNFHSTCTSMILYEKRWYNNQLLSQDSKSPKRLNLTEIWQKARTKQEVHCNIYTMSWKCIKRPWYCILRLHRYLTSHCWTHWPDMVHCDSHLNKVPSWRFDLLKARCGI